MTKTEGEPEDQGPLQINGKFGPDVKVFDGRPEDWPRYRLEMKAAAMVMAPLILQLLVEAADGGGRKTRSMTAKEQQASAMFFAKMVLTTSGSAQALVRGFEKDMDGRGAWQALVDKYEHKDVVRMVTLTRELVRDEMGEDENPVDFFARVDERDRQLAAMEVEIPRPLLVGIVLGNLPDRYKTLRTYLCASGTLRYELVKEHVQSHYRQEVADAKLKQRRGQEQALMARTPKPRKQTEGGGGNPGEPKKCWNCGEVGHFSYNCPNRRPEEEEEGQPRDVQEPKKERKAEKPAAAPAAPGKQGKRDKQQADEINLAQELATDLLNYSGTVIGCYEDEAHHAETDDDQEWPGVYN